jgi:FAS-associated factor 2
LAKIQKEEEEKQVRIQLEKEKEKSRKIEEKKKRKQDLMKKFEQEPSDSKDVTKLSIRLPSGQRIVRKFEVSSSINTVYEFVETQELAPLSLGAEFVLVKTFPRVVLQDLETDLESCGLLPTGSLIVEEKL